MSKSDPGNKAPKHLSPATRAWFEAVTSGFELEEHHRKLLLAACECWDRGVAARLVLERDGLTYTDRFGQPHARPEVRIENDSKTLFAKLTRELGLDFSEPADNRPPRITAGPRRH